jgi:hypothetical protein
MQAFIDYFDQRKDNTNNDFTDMLLKVFEERIIKTHKANYIQYLLLYYCSLDGASIFIQKFFSLLLIQSFSKNLAGDCRSICFSYLISFLASFRGLDEDLLREALKMALEKAILLKPNINPLSYAKLSQGFLYVLCYRYDIIKLDLELLHDFIEETIINNVQSLPYIETSILKEVSLLLECDDNGVHYKQEISLLQKVMKSQKEAKSEKIVSSHFLFDNYNLLPIVCEKIMPNIIFYTYRQEKRERKTSSVNTTNSCNIEVVGEPDIKRVGTSDNLIQS